MQPARVLVTGANGYIAAWLCRGHLEQGDYVIGTVRSVGKGAYLKKLFASYGNKFEVVVVEDITKPGAFDEAVKGVDAVQHTASPVRLDARTANELVDPAVRGTLGVLESAKNFGKSIRRVVILSSGAAVVQPAKDHTVFDESSWNDAAVEELKQKGDAASPLTLYRASKVLAERSAWEFMESNKGLVSWDIVAVNPPFVRLPPIHEVHSLLELNASMEMMYKMLNDTQSDAEALSRFSGWYVDVRDIAAALSQFARAPDVGGQRFIVAAGPLFWQDIVDAANETDPTIPVKGVPGATKGKPPGYTFSTSRAARVLGMQSYRSLETTVKDSLDYFKTFPAST
ncbi:NAD-P-binding protein [Vararia minispora EC-137]|uniref:NAD-P-binding protein n=1 Tax=Vararia minispora EC-137 TaxID=1314806 RepID=A0ACB8QIZ0_9AGAM|nr:NAD-P-binding protein [Vararia minispora EC-137]